MSNQLLDNYVKAGTNHIVPSVTANQLLSHYTTTNPQALTEPVTPIENKLVSSFRSIDPNRRAVVLTSFQKQAKSGNKDAARKLQLLTPHLDAPAPQQQDFIPKDLGSKLGSTLYDLGKGAVESAKTTTETIATAPHALNAAGIALASTSEANRMPKGKARTDFVAWSKQKVLDEIHKTPYGQNFGKTVAENNSIPVTKTLAGIGGKTLENVLNVGTLGEGAVGKQVVEQGLRAVASKLGLKIAAKIASKGENGYIRNLASGQFAKTAVHPDDASVMAGFIDHARGFGPKLSDAERFALEQDASRIAEHYGIGGAQTAAAGDPLKRLATAFDKVLRGSPEALRGIKGEGGFIKVPEGIKPTGKLVAGKAGQRLVEGAKVGAGYSVAEAGKNYTTDPSELAKQVGGGAALGAGLAVGAPLLAKAIGKTAEGTQRGIDRPIQQVAELRVMAAGKKPSEPGFAQAAKAEVANIRSNPTQLKAIDEAYKTNGFRNLTAETGKPGTAGVPVGVPVESIKPTKGAPLVQTADQAARADAIASSTKPNLSSRVKQYEAGLQETLGHIEQDSRYKKLLAEHGGDKVITNEAVLGAAKRLGPLDESAIINARPLDSIDTVTLVRAKATLNAASKDFTDNWQNMTEKGLSEADITKQAGHLAKLEAGYKIMSAEPGRATQIQSTFIDDAFKRAQKLKDLINETKGVTPEKRNERIAQDLADFDKKLAQVSKSGQISGSTAAKLKAAFVKYVGGTARGISEYGTAAKLSAPSTHLINLVSNLLTLPQRGAENIVRAGWGALKGETSLAEAKYIFGTSEGFKNASAQLVNDFKQVINPNAKDLVSSGKEEIKSVIPGKIGKVIRTPFNLLSASDNFFKSLLSDSELHQSAFSKAYKEGFRGQALNSRVAELVKSPTAEMVAQAEKVAKEFTFQDDPGVIGTKLSEILGKIPLLRLLIPFTKTPINLTKFNYQRTPLGVFSVRNIRDLANGGIERREAVARLGVGSALSIGTAMAVFNAGENITGAAPTNQGEKDNFYTAGKKPYSLLVNGKWIAYNRFAPLGMYITEAVGLRDALTSGNSKTAGNIFSSMAVTTAKGLSDLPFVSGISNVVAALNDPNNLGKANKAVGGVLTGLIPNVSRDIANTQDATARQATSITDQIKAMLPKVPGINPNFNKQSLPARTTTFGTDQTSTQSGLERGLIKITGNDQSTKLTKALDEIGRQTGYYPQPPNPKNKVNGKVLDPNQFNRYQKEAGNLFASKLEKALLDASFNQLSPDDKQRTLQKMVTDSRDKAANDVAGKASKNARHKIKSY